MQSGELIVTGHEKVVIPLHHHPHEVKCYFKHDHNMIPCNPHHVDELEYEVHITHRGPVLIIRWNVSAVREIVWETC